MFLSKGLYQQKEIEKKEHRLTKEMDEKIRQIEQCYEASFQQIEKEKQEMKEENRQQFAAYIQNKIGKEYELLRAEWNPTWGEFCFFVSLACGEFQIEITNRGNDDVKGYEHTKWHLQFRVYQLKGEHEHPDLWEIHRQMGELTQQIKNDLVEEPSFRLPSLFNDELISVTNQSPKLVFLTDEEYELWMMYMHGRTYKELTKETGKSIVELDNFVQRTRRKLN